jgi:hypothetical protein
MKRLLTATVATIALAAPAVATESPIESVDVMFEIQDIESSVAAEFWADLEGDLEAEILSLVSDRIDEDGAEISIDIDEFDVSKGFEGAIGLDSVLTGKVEVRNENDPSANTFFDLRVTVDEAARLKRENGGVELVAHDRKEVYAAMIETFAEGVVKRLR